MTEKAMGVVLKPEMCFESRISFGKSRPVSIFVGWLHLGNYLQECIAEVVTKLLKIFITIVRTFITVFFFRHRLVYNGHLKVATPGL